MSNKYMNYVVICNQSVNWCSTRETAVKLAQEMCQREQCNAHVFKRELTYALTCKAVLDDEVTS